MTIYELWKLHNLVFYNCVAKNNSVIINKKLRSIKGVAF